jgi:hypothetical protein
LTNEELVEVVDAVRVAMTRHGALALVEAGETILTRLYGGDYEAFCSQDPKKSVSLRQVAESLKVSRQTLANRVHVARQYPKLPEEIRDRLSPTHHVALVQAPPLERARIAREAVIADLTAAELRARIMNKPPPAPLVVDRSALGALGRALDRVEKESETSEWPLDDGVVAALEEASKRISDLRRRARRRLT